jgi:hypothetical protein
MAEKQLLSASVIKSLQKKAEEMRSQQHVSHRPVDTKNLSAQKPAKVISQSQSQKNHNQPVNLSKSSFSSSEVTDDILSALIEKDRSFEITGLEADGAMTQMIERLEKAMGKQRKRCRVYTAGRWAAVAAAAIPTGVTQVTGAAAAIGIGLHNFATYNPDYEIAKHLVDKKLSVHKKEVTMENGKPKTRASFLADLTIAAAGAIADGITKTAEKGAKAQGRTAEFKQQKAQFDAARKQIGSDFRKLTGKEK